MDELFRVILVAVVVGLPVAWLWSEFSTRRVLRITLGILTLGVVSLVVWTVNSLTIHFNDNAWYGGATDQLLSTSVQQIEDGQLDRVLTVWRSLDRQFQPTYENRAGYQELVEDAVGRMRGEVPIESGSVWDASVFAPETWLGHWEDDTGFWLVIGKTFEGFEILRSGDLPEETRFLSLSPDSSVLKFQEGDQWLHTLTLKNKYEATHEWYDLERGSPWKTDTLHKLVRPVEERKAATHQDGLTDGS